MGQTQVEEGKKEVEVEKLQQEEAEVLEKKKREEEGAFTINKRPRKEPRGRIRVLSSVGSSR